MRFNIKVSGFSLEDQQKEYIERKLEVLQRYSQNISEETMDIDVSVIFNESLGQDEKYDLKVVVSVPGASFRSEVQALSPEEGVDLIHDKLKRQIDRYKSKFIRMHRRNVVRDTQVEGLVGELTEDDGLDPRVNKRKLFTNLIPMTEKEAIENMEMLGHGFFLFVNVATDRYNMVYKRPNSGGFGVIELEHEVGVLNG